MLANMDDLAVIVAKSCDMKSSAKETVTRSASDVKGHWRDIVDEVNAVGEVVVTNYNRPEVVVVSIERYAKLKKDALAGDPLAVLRAEFDRELATLRRNDAPNKLRDVFASSARKTAKAATAASRRKR